MSQSYRLRTEFFAALTRRAAAQAVFLSLVASAAGYFISARTAGPSSAGTLVVVGPLLLAAMGFGIYSSLRRERAAWESLEVLVSDASITRRMSGRPDITLTPQSVQSISEVPNGTLTIRGASINETIFIPYQLHGLAEVRAVLSRWHAISPQAARPTSALNILASIAVVGLMIVAFTSRTAAIAAPAALILAVGLIWSGVFIHRSAHYDQRVRRTAWLVLLPVLALLARAYSLLFP